MTKTETDKNHEIIAGIIVLVLIIWGFWHFRPQGENSIASSSNLSSSLSATDVAINCAEGTVKDDLKDSGYTSIEFSGWSRSSSPSKVTGPVEATSLFNVKEKLKYSCNIDGAEYGKNYCTKTECTIKK